MENYKKPELLSPAGDYETLIAAVENGADAVYIGGTNFSARKNAKNFTDEDIINAVKYAHLRNVKVYVTLNTLIYDSELEGVFEFIGFCYKAGVDALIVQDLAIVYMCRKYFPDFEIHSSTQMTISSINGVKMMEQLGFSRVVLAREMSKDEIKKVCTETETEIEIFVHGALCVCYSGQCLFSSLIGGRSGNRGNCAQPCRLPYSVYDYEGKCIADKKYVLSLKDYNLVDYLDEIEKLGAHSLKIEGRMKSKEYVSIVTDIYKRRLEKEHLNKSDYFRLENIFSRTGFTDGYYMGKIGKDMLSILKSNDDIYKNVSENVLSYGEELSEKHSRKRSVSFQIKISDEILCSVKSENIEFEYLSDIKPQKAEKSPITSERICEQFKKLGDTAFVCDKVSAKILGTPFVSVKDLNTIRRECIKKLESIILSNNRKCRDVSFHFKQHKRKCEKIALNAEVTTLKQAELVLTKNFDNVFVPYEIFLNNKKRFEKLGNVVCVLPQTDNLSEYNLEGISKIAVSNIGQIYGLKNKELYGQPSLNVFNSISADMYADLGLKSVSLSYELNLNKIKAFNTNACTEIVIYGRVPLMNSKSCIHRALKGNCGCSSEKFLKLNDRKNKTFYVKTNPINCTNTIYNSEPIYMADKLSELESAGVSSLRMLFTTETDDEILKIIDNYENKKSADITFTRGHFYRGV